MKIVDSKFSRSWHTVQEMALVDIHEANQELCRNSLLGFWRFAIIIVISGATISCSVLSCWQLSTTDPPWPIKRDVDSQLGSSSNRSWTQSLRGQNLLACVQRVTSHFAYLSRFCRLSREDCCTEALGGQLEVKAILR